MVILCQLSAEELDELVGDGAPGVGSGRAEVHLVLQCTRGGARDGAARRRSCVRRDGGPAPASSIPCLSEIPVMLYNPSRHIQPPLPLSVFAGVFKPLSQESRP